MKKVTFIRMTSIVNEPRVPKEAKVLQDMGLDVKIIFWDRVGIDKDITEFNGLELLPIFIGKAGYGKGIYNFKFRLKINKEILKKLKTIAPDIIHACDFDGLIPALLYKKIYNKNVKIVYDIFDFIYTMNSPIPDFVRKTIKQTEQFLLRYVDAIILPDKNRISFIDKSFHNKIYIVNNAPKIEKKLTEVNTSESSKIKIFYGGALSADRGILWLGEIAKKYTNIEVIIAGDGILKDKVIKFAKEIPNIQYVGKLSTEEIYEKYYPTIDIVYAVYDPSFIHNKFSSPTKLFEALHFQKPVIMTRGTYWDEIVEKYNCGYVVDYDVESLKKLIEKLTKKDIELKAKNTIKLYEEVKWENSEKNLKQLYRDIFSE